MRHSVKLLSFAAAFAVAPLSALADPATLSALEQAGIALTPELSAKVEAAQGEELASAIAEVVASLGQNTSIEAAIIAAVGASPELAMEITSAACLSNPGACAVIAGAAAKAAPGMAPDIAAAAAQAAPGQQDMITNTVIASVNNEAMNEAIRRAVAVGGDQPEENASGGSPSPN